MCFDEEPDDEEKKEREHLADTLLLSIVGIIGGVVLYFVNLKLESDILYTVSLFLFGVSFAIFLIILFWDFLT